MSKDLRVFLLHIIDSISAIREYDDFRSRHPQIPWKSIAGFRDVLIHQYFGVDPSMVWATIENQLPALEKVVTDELAKSATSKEP